MLLHAGVSSGSALTLMADEEEGERREILSRMANIMDGGETLYKAFCSAEAFPEYVCGLIRVGEETGKTEEALTSLSKYYEQRARLDVRVRAALLYPSVLLLIMLAVVVVLLTQVMPVFNDVYASLGGQLTGVAGTLLKLGTVLDGAMPVLCVLLGAVVIFLAAFASVDSFRDKLLSSWRKARGDKGIAGKLNTARFAQALSMGIGSGMPVEDALDLAAVLLADMPRVGEKVRLCREKLDSGAALGKAVGDAGLLPQSESRLLELGIKSGSQDTVMEHISERLSEDADVALEMRIGQIEPTLVIAASVLVGVILLSVMLPLMNIMTAIG